MQMSMIEKRIQEKAVNRWELLLKDLREKLWNNEILFSLKIYKQEDKKEYFKLIGKNGHCPATDLFSVDSLLLKNTNIEEIKSDIMEKFIKEETDALLEKIDNLKEFLESNS